MPPGSAKTLYKIIVGAKEYYDGTATPKEGEQPAPKTEWDTVGVKALNDYTLQYTLKNPVAYFLSMVDNQAFMPVYGPFLTEKVSSLAWLPATIPCCTAARTR